MPYDWRGTTFNNSERIYVGREAFAQNLTNLVLMKEETGGAITESDLVGLGNAEDYLRVATNLSTVLELFLATKKGYTVSQVWTFASAVMPVLSVSLLGTKPVHLYIGDSTSELWSSTLQSTLLAFNCPLTISAGAPQKREHDNEVVLALEPALQDSSVVDGIVGNCVLYIVNTSAIHPHSILLARKRMATPVSTPLAEHLIRQLCDPSIGDFSVTLPPADSLAALYGHLQTLSGTPVDPFHFPQIFTAGLVATASFYITLTTRGGADICMCSTAYGGSSQLLDLLTAKTSMLTKHTFNIQGEADMVERISQSLTAMASSSVLLPLTVLFVEIPTNPDMKIPDLRKVVELILEYQEKTGKQVLLLVDTTFAPNSKILHKIRNISEHLPAMAFVSLSKSISGGFTTCGTLVANHTSFSQQLLQEIKATAKVLDTDAKPEQLHVLAERHVGVEERLQKAYENAATVANALSTAVKEAASYDMPIKFVSREHALEGYPSSTFSFNLPALTGVSREVNEGLAQHFVDLLCLHPQHFKPCVSFGQDNNLVYCTVPATSTQGAIKAEDKDKQAVGGVQLVRLSFPPNGDIDVVCKIVVDSVYSLYK